MEDDLYRICCGKNNSITLTKIMWAEKKKKSEKRNKEIKKQKYNKK